MRVVWSQTALDHIEYIADYIAQHSPAAAFNLSTEIFERTDKLADNPMIGRRGRISGTRELVLSGTSYIVVYEVSDRVDVLAVFHGAREWPDQF